MTASRAWRAGQLLHRYHEAVSSFEPPPESVWSSGAHGAPGPDQIVLHGDPGPWNMIWVDGVATALIDWDHANPGHPLDDLAYLVLYAAPLCSDEEALGWMHHETIPDRRHRLQLLADSYGTAAEGLLARAVNVHAGWSQQRIEAAIDIADRRRFRSRPLA